MFERAFKVESAFINLTVRDANAEFIGAHFKNGDELYIEGELRSKKVKIGDNMINSPFVLVSKAKFTYGAKRLVNAE